MKPGARPGAGRSRDGLISDAFLALVRCVDTLDPDKGRLTSLVAVAVRNEVSRNSAEPQTAIHVPTESLRAGSATSFSTSNSSSEL